MCFAVSLGHALVRRQPNANPPLGAPSSSPAAAQDFVNSKLHELVSWPALLAFPACSCSPMKYAPTYHRPCTYLAAQLSVCGVPSEWVAPSPRPLGSRLPSTLPLLQPRLRAPLTYTRIPNPHPSMQALAIREMGSYVCELERVGKGLPTFHFDRWALAAGIGRVAPSLQAQLPQQAT